MPQKMQIRKGIMTVRTMIENRIDFLRFSHNCCQYIFLIIILLNPYFFTGINPTLLTMFCPFSLNTKSLNSFVSPAGSPFV